MVAVINDVQFLCDRAIRWEQVFHMILRLLAPMGYTLQASYLLQIKDLQVIPRLRQSIDTVPQKQL